MGSRALLLLSYRAPITHSSHFSFTSCREIPHSVVKRSFVQYENPRSRNYSTTKSSLEPPKLPRLAETARISLTPDEVEEFAPKIRQVVDWFGQLQAVDLESIKPAIRAGTLQFEGKIYFVWQVFYFFWQVKCERGAVV